MKHKSEDYKISAVQYYLENNKSQTNTCKIFKCSRKSLMRWVNRYIKNGSIKRYHRHSISYKVKVKHIEFMKTIIKDNKTITITELNYLIKKKFNDFNISERHLDKVLDDNYITLKLKRFIHEPVKRYGKDVNIKELIKNFYKEIKKYKLDDIICIDETSLNSYQVRKYCYSDEGKRCIIKTHNQEVFKKYTGIFAITTKGCIGYEIYEKNGIDSNRLINFLEKYIVNKNKNKLIILDNASCHRSESIKNLINKDNTLLYSVVYQHYTNCIENYFSILKNYLYKIKDIGYKKMNRNIENIIKQIPLNIYENIFKGSYQRNKEFKIKKHRRIKQKVYKI
jgi:transposase